MRPSLARPATDANGAYRAAGACPPSRGSGECVVVPIGKASLFSEAWPMRSLRPHQARTPSRRRFRQLGDGAFGLSIGDRLDSVEPMTSTPPATRSSLDARSERAPLDSGVPLARDNATAPDVVAVVGLPRERDRAPSSRFSCWPSRRSRSTRRSRSSSSRCSWPASSCWSAWTSSSCGGFWHRCSGSPR